MPGFRFSVTGAVYGRDGSDLELPRIREHTGHILGDKWLYKTKRYGFPKPTVLKIYTRVSMELSKWIYINGLLSPIQVGRENTSRKKKTR